MLFNSSEYLLCFLPVTFLVYFFLTQQKLIEASKIWLVVASLFFYSWWKIDYLPLLLLSASFNYMTAGIMMKKHTGTTGPFSRKSVLLLGLAGNIGLLGYFKYMDFFIANINLVTGLDIGLLRIVLPLGISFYTITQIAFLLDVYEGLVKERNFLHYLLFVTFFPHLIVGPILHHKDMMSQFDSLRNKRMQYENVAKGIFLISIGLVKKLLIADYFSVWANSGFEAANTLTFFEAWCTSLSYTLQLYFDFSGYTDMALGSALLFNIRLPVNFNSPLKARSIIEFWQSWHMSLTNFISTYLYNAILRSFEKVTFAKAMVATFIAMTIMGFWHGASWIYVVYGMIQGSAIIVNHLWRKRKKKMPPLLAWFITFHFTNATLVLFRSESFSQAGAILKSMCGLSEISLWKVDDPQAYHFLRELGIRFDGLVNALNSQLGGVPTIVVIVTFLLVAVLTKNSIQMKDALTPTTRGAVLTGIGLFLGLLFAGSKSEFLYFQF